MYSEKIDQIKGPNYVIPTITPEYLYESTTESVSSKTSMSVNKAYSTYESYMPAVTTDGKYIAICSNYNSTKGLQIYRANWNEAGDNINNLTIEDICNAAKNGDEMSITVLKEAARYIGIAITNLINILNPTAIVVVGEIFENTTYAIDTLSEIVKNRGFKLSSENVRIIRSLLGRDASVIGAATLVIQEIFNGINKN